MKTLLIGCLFISLTSLTFAQNEIAYLYAQPENIKSLSELQNNSKYLSFFKTNDLSKRIIKLQKTVANYDISEHAIYDKKDASVYIVEFTEAQNKIIVQYNQDGNIIKSNEKYKNVRLPYSISSQISKSNPGWSFNNNIVTFEYSKDGNIKSQYKVFLEKNNKRKIVLIKTDRIL